MGLGWELFGKQFGNFRLDEGVHKVFFGGLKEVKHRLPKIKRLFFPNPNSRFFTNRIVPCDRNCELFFDGFLTLSKEPADGGMVFDSNYAVAFTVADCPITALFEPGEPARLAVLHSGFRGLVRETLGELSIIKAAFEKLKFNPDQVRVFVGFGIGPCCYGAEHLPEVRNMELPLPLSRAIRGPRRGQVSVDLYKLIRGQLLECGVPLERITFDSTCTACAGDRERLYYSHTWEGRDTGRNLALAWF